MNLPVVASLQISHHLVGLAAEVENLVIRAEYHCCSVLSATRV